MPPEVERPVQKKTTSPTVLFSVFPVAMGTGRNWDSLSIDCWNSCKGDLISDELGKGRGKGAE